MASLSTLLLLVCQCMAMAALLAAIVPASADCGIGSISLAALSNTDFTYESRGSLRNDRAPETHQWLVRPCAPTLDPTCLKAGAQTSACEDDIAFGYWTTDLWHKWSFIDGDAPNQGVQLLMQGSPAPAGCNALGTYYSWTLFPCAATQGNLTVVQGADCSANFTIPTPLTCHMPGNSIELQ